MRHLISDPIHRAERLYGGVPAVVDGDRRFTYGEFAERCRRLAGALAAGGVGRGDRVATLLANGHRYLEAYFAVPAMGAVLVPLNNRHAAPEHEYILGDAGVHTLLVDEANGEMGRKLAASVSRVLEAPGPYEEALARAEPPAFPEDLAEDELAVLFYTGGTTGRSKGAILSHRNILANALHAAIALGYGDGDTYLHAAPMFHLADGMATYAVTWLGGRHVFVPAFEAGAVLDEIARSGVTCSTLVPTMINALTHHPDVHGADLSSLRLIVHGGAPIATELLRSAIAALGCSFAQAYGMTEAAPLVTVLPAEEQWLDHERLRSAGREIAGVSVDVRRESGEPCAPGEIGEVVCRGPNMMAGYWNKPEETAKALRDGWYWTGDLGYLDDEGYLFLVDRAKDMIISGGENVYSTEVEDAVIAHPEVLEAVVVGIPHDSWGEQVHAVVVRVPGGTVTEDELKAFCKERIAGYKCPRSVDFRDELPKSGAGKILKREIRDEYWAGQSRRIN